MSELGTLTKNRYGWRGSTRGGGVSRLGKSATCTSERLVKTQEQNTNNLVYHIIDS